MPCSMILLPADLATISSASRMGTPDEIMVPSVRVKRATATFRTSGPNTGVLSTNACHSSCPRPCLVAARKATHERDRDDHEPVPVAAEPAREVDQELRRAPGARRRSP